MVQGGSERQRLASETAMLVVGVAAALAGLIGLGVVAYWYATDMGWTGTGALLVESRAQARATALVPIVAVLVGLMAVLVRRLVPLRSPGGVLVLVTNVVVTAGVVLAVAAYPHGEAAELSSHRDGGWTSELPITEVWGVRSETDSTLTLEGRADRRGCDWRIRAVTLELATGRILGVETLPTSHESGEIPADPTPIDPERFEVRQGSVPFICRS